MVLKRTTIFLSNEDFQSFRKLNKKLNLEEDTEFTYSGRIRQVIRKFLRDNGISISEE